MKERNCRFYLESNGRKYEKIEKFWKFSEVFQTFQTIAFMEDIIHILMFQMNIPSYKMIPRSPCATEIITI